MFKKLFGTPSTTVEDFDDLLKLAGKGNFQDLLSTAQANTSTMRMQADSLAKDAAGTESAAQKVYDDETRVARQKLQTSKDKAAFLRGKATAMGAEAKQGTILLSKFKK